MQNSLIPAVDCNPNRSVMVSMILEAMDTVGLGGVEGGEVFRFGWDAAVHPSGIIFVMCAVDAKFVNSSGGL